VSEKLYETCIEKTWEAEDAEANYHQTGNLQSLARIKLKRLYPILEEES